MHGFGQRLGSIIIVYSLASCSATWNQTWSILGFKKSSHSSEPASGVAAAPTPTPDDLYQKAILDQVDDSKEFGPGATPVVAAETPTAPPIPEAPVLQVSAGEVLLRGHGAYTKFAHYVSKQACATGIDAEVAVFNPTTAVLLVDACKPIAPLTLPPKTITMFGAEPAVLRFKDKVFDREVVAAAVGGAATGSGVPAGAAAGGAGAGMFTKIICDESRDSAGRPVTALLKTDARGEHFFARLTLVGLNGPEAYEFTPTHVAQQSMNMYQVGKSGQVPYFNFMLGNFNGVAVFVSYDLDANRSIMSGGQHLAKGKFAASRKENNLSLGHCYSP